jgi:flagellin-like hook-associated protein FlgL
MATAVTDLTQTETAQQALVQAGAQISQLNLFNYLPAP